MPAATRHPLLNGLERGLLDWQLDTCDALLAGMQVRGMVVCEVRSLPPLNARDRTVQVRYYPRPEGTPVRTADGWPLGQTWLTLEWGRP